MYVRKSIVLKTKIKSVQHTFVFLSWVPDQMQHATLFGAATSNNHHIDFVSTGSTNHGWIHSPCVMHLHAVHTIISKETI